MDHKSIPSRLVLLFASTLIILNAVFLSKHDEWAVDLFYYLSFFSLVIVLDFMLYELKCPGYKGRDHIVFCTFPVSRWSVLILEIKYYIKRWELLVFLVSVLFYISWFYFQNNSEISQIIPLLILVPIQLFFFICLLFLMKDMIRRNNFNTSVKNIYTVLNTLIILIVSFADNSRVIELIFYINPLSSGLVSYLMGFRYAMISYSLIFLLTGSAVYLVTKRFSEWPLS